MLDIPANDARRLALGQDVIVPYALIAIEVGATRRHTNAPYDITESGQTFRSDGKLVGAVVPPGRNDVGSDPYVIMWADPNKTLYEEYKRYGVVGRDISVGLVFMTGVTQAVMTAQLDIYTGHSLSAVHEILEETGPVTTVTYDGELAKVDSTRQMIATAENQAQRSATDTSHRYIARTQGTSFWGGRG